MMTPQTARQLVARVGSTVYKALLGLYPRAFRREFGFDMIQDFEEASHDAWTDDHWRGVLSLWLLTAADIVRSVPVQWVRSGALIFSGLALMSAASCAAAVGVLDPTGTLHNEVEQPGARRSPPADSRDDHRCADCGDSNFLSAVLASGTEPQRETSPCLKREP